MIIEVSDYSKEMRKRDKCSTKDADQQMRVNIIKPQVAPEEKINKEHRDSASKRHNIRSEASVRNVQREENDGEY